MEKENAILDSRGPLRVNNWSNTALYGLSAAILLLGFTGIGEAIGGDMESFGTTLFFLIQGLTFARLAMQGVVVKDDGLLVRTFLWAHYWTWHEIERFDLRDTVYTPNLQMIFTDGKEIGVKGLAARSISEKRRAREICEALNERLAIEHQKASHTVGSTH